jgi:hypothetical protein
MPAGLGNATERPAVAEAQCYSCRLVVLIEPDTPGARQQVVGVELGAHIKRLVGCDDMIDPLKLAGAQLAGRIYNCPYTSQTSCIIGGGSAYPPTPNITAPTIIAHADRHCQRQYQMHGDAFSADLRR